MIVLSSVIRMISEVVDFCFYGWLLTDQELRFLLEADNIFTPQGSGMHWTPLSSPSPCDRVLQPFFFIVRRVLSFTVIRLFSLLTLLPLYLTVKLLRAAPHIIPRLHLLLYPDGWRKLIYSAYRYRDIELERTKAQLHGEYQFESSQLIKPSKDEIQKRANWFPCTEIFQVCGANICVVHEAPKVGRQNSGVKILLLHGNPSWSFMWRDVSSVSS